MILALMKLTLPLLTPLILACFKSATSAQTRFARGPGAMKHSPAEPSEQPQE